MGPEGAVKPEKLKPVSFNELVKMAANGQEEDWAAIDEHLKTFPLSEAYLHWALYTGLTDSNKHVRDFAVSLFNATDIPISVGDTQILTVALQDPYHIVRIRAAMALWKRGSRDAIAEHILRKAADEKDPDLGAAAQECLNITDPKPNNNTDSAETTDLQKPKN